MPSVSYEKLKLHIQNYLHKNPEIIIWIIKQRYLPNFMRNPKPSITKYLDKFVWIVILDDGLDIFLLSITYSHYASFDTPSFVDIPTLKIHVFFLVSEESISRFTNRILFVQFKNSLFSFLT
jgi:hypothetical protein